MRLRVRAYTPSTSKVRSDTEQRIGTRLREVHSASAIRVGIQAEVQVPTLNEIAGTCVHAVHVEGQIGYRTADRYPPAGSSLRFRNSGRHSGRSSGSDPE